MTDDDDKTPGLPLTPGGELVFKRLRAWALEHGGIESSERLGSLVCHMGIAPLGQDDLKRDELIG